MYGSVRRSGGGVGEDVRGGDGVGRILVNCGWGFLGGEVGLVY